MYFTDCVVKAFLWDVFLKQSVCIRRKLRREVPFKLIFIRYNMEPLEDYEDEDKLEDLLLRLFLLCFLLEDVRCRFLVFRLF